MYFPEDEHIAQTLQSELDLFQNLTVPVKCIEKENKNPVDSELEFIDPTPNIHDLFVRFNEKFFWGMLGMVEVKWSNRMTQCAGLCYFEGKQGLCKICLSAPLLSFRPRKDLVETLLHEMIHAYLFVTNNFRDREDHGPKFRSHMYRINQQAGTNITVYHTFYDEVDFYKRHIWRCDGPCRSKRPYFGFVRRSMNRAPGPNDNWWQQHKAHCNGTFIKISEPEQKTKTSKVIKKSVGKEKLNDIRFFFNPESPNSSFSSQKNVMSITGEVSKAKEKIESVTISNFKKVNVNLSNNSKKQNSILKETISDNKDFIQIEKNSADNKSSQGHEFAQDWSEQNSKDLKGDVREVVRSVWVNKFYSKSEDSNEPVSKKIKNHYSECEEDLSEFDTADADADAHLKKCLNTQQESKGKCRNESFRGENFEKQLTEEPKNCPVCNKEVLKSELNDHLENCLENCCSFVNEERSEKIKDEISCQSLPCPCCYKWFLESQMNEHLDECLTLIALKEGLINP